MKKYSYLVMAGLLWGSVSYANSNAGVTAEDNVLADTIHIDEVVVTGTRIQVSRNNMPLTISVINRNEIQESSESALLPVLSQRVPGLFITEKGMTGFGTSTGAAGQISIRGVGSSNGRILILIDGHPQYMGLFGHPLPDAYIARDAERVEVSRGPSSLLYGSSAMGGVINIITRKQMEDGFKSQAR
ncbi:MAG: TonB-dependent receptor plug domain-containing protein, partial [Bacteroidales bacterium]|nr:TonB-dependent receptor plug domain-containing protein [Bacteroidales bacterium]